ASEEFTGIAQTAYDLWVPLPALVAAHPGVPVFQRILTEPHYCCSDVSGRLAPGVTRDQATAELTTLSARFEAQFRQPPHRVIATGTSVLARPDAKKAQILSAFGLLVSAVLAILLLACANVSNLLLARGTARQSEIGVRLALGASRGRVVRQLLTEGFLLAGIASLLATGVAAILPRVVIGQVGAAPGFLYLAPDWRVLTCSAGLAFVSAVAFGLAPALRVTKAGIHHAIQHQARQTGFRFPLRSALLGAQVAISTLLLVIAGLMARGLSTAQNHDPGFRVNGVTMASVDLPINHYNGARWREFFVSLESRITAAAGGRQVGFCAMPPLSRAHNVTSLQRDGKPAEPILLQFVNGAYFDVLSIPVLAGRKFTGDDRARNVVMANEAAVRRYWPNGNPVGRIAMVNGKPEEIIGVVRDAEINGIGEVQPLLFLPFQGGDPANVLVRGEAKNWSHTLKGIIFAAEPRATVEVRDLSTQLEKWLGPARLGAEIAGALGLLALLLAAVGVYGVVSYSVEQRRRELGVRMALGAHPGEVVRFVLRGNARGVVWGLAAGFGLSALAGQVIRRFLYGVAPDDPLAYGAALAILLAAGFAASFAPARKSARIDPSEALRWE
ncbi:MAG TPA: FtsX-like permease family protein, partial [Bryobacteraceae bacterium]|nr:FtsX-like permease family protein [Bryobacteraceae bacterium]